MDSQWREKKLYPVLGTLAIFSLLYLNFSDHLDFEFPVVLWRLPEARFVGVNGTRFVLLEGGGSEGPRAAAEEEFYVNGWNSYWLMQESVRSAASRRRVAEMLKRGAGMGLTVCRTWAFSDGPGSESLQLRPSVFNERVFKVSYFSPFCFCFGSFFMEISYRLDCFVR